MNNKKKNGNSLINIIQGLDRFENVDTKETESLFRAAWMKANNEQKLYILNELFSLESSIKNTFLEDDNSKVSLDMKFLNKAEEEIIKNRIKIKKRIRKNKVKSKKMSLYN